MARRVTPCSPSKLGGARLCPKFRYKAKDDGVSADRGTLLHDAFAKSDLTGLDPEDAQAVNMAMATASAMRSDLAMECPGEVIEELVEFRVRFEALALEGTLDRAYKTRTRAKVLDLKTGALGLPSKAAENVQVKAYILGLFDKFPELEIVDGALTNPVTLEHTDDLRITRADLPAIEAELRALVEAYEDPFAVPTPGEHCSHCECLDRCWALKPTIMKHTAALWPMTPQDLDPTNPNLSLAARGMRKLLTQFLEAYVEAVKENDKVWCGLHEDPPLGFKRMERSTGVRILDEARHEAIKRLLTVIPEEAVYSCCNIAIGALAKVVPGTTEAQGKALVLSTLEGLTREGRTAFLQRDKKSATTEEILEAYRLEKGREGVPAIDVT